MQLSESISQFKAEPKMNRKYRRSDTRILPEFSEMVLAVAEMVSCVAETTFCAAEITSCVAETTSCLAETTSYAAEVTSAVAEITLRVAKTISAIATVREGISAGPYFMEGSGCSLTQAVLTCRLKSVTSILRQ